MCYVYRHTDVPYLRYEEVDFDVLVGSYGDCFDR